MHRTTDQQEDTGDLDARLGELLGEVEEASDELGSIGNPPDSLAEEPSAQATPDDAADGEFGDADLDDAIEALLEESNANVGASDATPQAERPDADDTAGDSRSDDENGAADLEEALGADLDALLEDGSQQTDSHPPPAEEGGGVAEAQRGETAPDRDAVETTATRPGEEEEPEEAPVATNAETLDEELAGVGDEMLREDPDDEADAGWSGSTTDQVEEEQIEDRPAAQRQPAAADHGDEEKRGDAPGDDTNESAPKDDGDAEATGTPAKAAAADAGPRPAASPHETDATAAVAPRRAARAIGRLSGAAASAGSVMLAAGRRVEPSLRAACAAVSRPVQGLHPNARQAIGWFGLMTLFWAVVVIVYAAFIRGPGVTQDPAPDAPDATSSTRD